MTTNTVKIRRLAALADRAEAADLVAEQIAHVKRHQIHIDDDSGEHQFVREFLAEAGEVDLPRDVWLGAWRGDVLVGALHGGAQVQQAAGVAERIVTGVEGAAGPGWVGLYVQRCAMVDELAVHPAHRWQGVARRLLGAMHGVLITDLARDVRHITAHAASPAAVAVFRNAGYTIGAPSTPVPPEYAEGLTTVWHPGYDALGGGYVYRHVDLPESFV